MKDIPGIKPFILSNYYTTLRAGITVFVMRDIRISVASLMGNWLVETHFLRIPFINCIYLLFTRYKNIASVRQFSNHRTRGNVISRYLYFIITSAWGFNIWKHISCYLPTKIFSHVSLVYTLFNSIFIRICTKQL